MWRGLERARTEPWVHLLALLVALVVGVALAWLHWLGLVAGGALVGLVSRSLPRALVGGVGFGLVVLAVFAASLGGSGWRLLEMAPAVYVTLGAALGLPALGALVRGVV
nr:hypothetical protein [Natrononativus amylolyticus]